MAEEYRYKRVLLKLSGEALAGDLGYGIDPKVVDSLADEIAGLEPEARLTAQAGAVAGDPFELGLAAVAAAVGRPA